MFSTPLIIEYLEFYTAAKVWKEDTVVDELRKAS
jgi:hypothetical protein